ncbi:MAG: acyl-CoA dehydratase activase [Coriobacteriia bacterium]|nr:acyl-CoA dehydratase activase [Coriobacteriia bacterium]
MTYKVGIDIGSTATKACVLDGENAAFTLVIPTGFSSVEAGRQVLAALADAGFPQEECRFCATGYGRVAVPFAEKTVTEITCHGKGAARLFGPDGVVVDIGGQDTKAIVLRGGKVVDFRMNDKCSAGTGKFLEIMANRMGLTQDEMSALARTGKPTTISSMCTVFAESEVISLIGQGTPREDISWGVVESVASKVSPLVPQVAGAAYFLTGGLCENEYLIERLSAQLGTSVQTCAQARFAGALGAALSLE